MIRFLWFITLFWSMSVHVAWAETRLALVIGNSAYTHAAHLPNAAADAKDVGDALDRIGFDVTRGIDLDYRDMRLTLRDFSRSAIEADTVLIYFAGHGIEIENTNYLIPTNAELRSDQDIEFETVRLDAVLGAAAASKGLKIVLVDACRNNPFVSQMQRTSATRSIGRGLARVDPGGVLVGYAARGGTLALDGEGRNSPYAQALLAHLEEPGLELGKMFRKVRDTVFDLTDGYQEPFTYGSLPGEDIFLVPAVLRMDDGPTIAEDFAQAAAIGTIAAWTEFLEKHTDNQDHPLTVLASERLTAAASSVAPGLPTGDDPADVQGVATSTTSAPAGLPDENDLASNTSPTVETGLPAPRSQPSAGAEDQDFARELAAFAAAEKVASPRGWALFFDQFPNGRMQRSALLQEHSDFLDELRDRVWGRYRAKNLGREITQEMRNAAQDMIRIDTRQITRLQNALVFSRLDVGGIDGQLGPRTRDALRRFQSGRSIPVTGLPTRATLQALTETGGWSTTGRLEFTADVFPTSSAIARIPDPEALRVLEKDPRLDRAVAAFPGRQIVYGYFNGRLYFVTNLGTTFGRNELAQIEARTGGRLVEIDTPEENAFVRSLVRFDQKFWGTASIGNKNGPAIGLEQVNGTWQWRSGAALSYRNWASGQPQRVPEGSTLDESYGRLVPLGGIRPSQTRADRIGWATATALPPTIILEIE